MLGDRDSGVYLQKFSWTRIVRHQLVSGGSSPDDPTLADYWAGVNACMSRTETETGIHSLTSFTDCRDGADVQHYVIKGSGHAWPGGSAPRAAADPAIDTIDINELIWAFFSLH